MSGKVDTIENIFRVAVSLLVLFMVFVAFVWPKIGPKPRHDGTPSGEPETEGADGGR